MALNTVCSKVVVLLLFIHCLLLLPFYGGFALGSHLLCSTLYIAIFY